MRLTLLLLLLVTPLALADSYKEIGPSWVFTTDQKFSDAKDNLIFAIESRGLVISYISHASAMLERTSGAVEQSKTIYDDAEILLFCKANLSHALVNKNPHYLTLCPYSIAVYTLADQPNQAYLSMPKPYRGDAVTKPITELLVDIIEEVQDGF